MTIATPRERLTEDAPAKINLALHITGQREDGYHLIETLVVFATFGDRLFFSTADKDRFTVSGQFSAGLPRHDNDTSGNLVLKARNLLRAFAKETGQQHGPVHIQLKKELPLASGIGGGSADAAATLRGLIRLWGLDCDQQHLSRLALKLGADVPMCLIQTPLIARGVGDEIMAINGFPPLSIVLVNPMEPVSTPTIFNALTSKRNSPLVTGRQAVNTQEWLDFIAENRNDLQVPASHSTPVIHTVIDALYAANSSTARMSGSGATCFGLYPDFKHANTAAKALGSAYPNWFVIACQTFAESE